MTSTKQRTSFTCWHPILPAFSARTIIALRTLLGIACVATFTLGPWRSTSIKGQLLLGVTFIVAIKNTLGATIQSAIRLILGGFIAAIYCLLVINILPKDIYYAVGATIVLVFLIVYTDLPVTVRRFTIVPTCIILLQWFNPEKKYIDSFFVLRILIIMIIGSTLSVLVTCIPFPAVPTAYRELILRMRFIARQTRREITAIVLLISEYHNTHSMDFEHFESTNLDKSKTNSPEDNDNGIEMRRNSSFNENILHHSNSFEDLRDDHLLKSDIQDLHSLVNDELKQMQRAIGEISYEPYFICLKILNGFRRILRHIPWIKKCIGPDSTLEARLEVWSTGLASIQRTISGMLLLDHHHHAFVGQQRLINAICLLLDSTFNFLDATLPYTTASKQYVKTTHIMSCRAKVEEALEDFFETYTQVRENPRHSSISNTDAIRLNTFLLLILRLVHATITAAEASRTPGTHLDDSIIMPEQTSKTKKPFDWKKPFNDLATYIGIRPSSGKLIRSIKTSLSVLVSFVIVYSMRQRLQAYGWVYWAPMTTALVSESSEGSTLRISFQRLMAVLLGSTYAYVIVRVTQDHLAVGICICSFVGLMGYLKTDPRKEYFASVCAQSASIITFLSNQGGKMNASNDAVLARTSLTFVGIFIHVFISNLIFPITARALIKKKVSLMLKNVSGALKSSCDDFCSFIGPSTTNPQITTAVTKTPSNLMKILGETERIADSFPALLEEAINEPNFWKRPFVQVKDRYDDISKSLRRISVDIRFVHRCTTILEAESKLHFAQEAKWLVRRTSLAHSNMNTEIRPSNWTTTELRKEQKLQNDLDIPLSIFLTYSPNTSPTLEQKPLISNSSSASLRLAHTTLYRPVLEHIRTLENHILQVLSLTGQLIEKQATVDVGSLELQQLYRSDSFDEQQQAEVLQIGKPLNRGPSLYTVPKFEALPLSTNHYKFCSCCRTINEDQQPLPSLRNAVDQMLASLIQFLYANNRFIRTEFVANQSIGDVLAFHTLSYALKDMVEATTNLAKNARRIKHINTHTFSRDDRHERSPSHNHQSV